MEWVSVRVVEDLALYRFHHKCVVDSVKVMGTCPTCRVNLSRGQITLCKTMMRETSKDDAEKTKFGSKLVAIRDVLRRIHARSKDQSIVFIQFANIRDAMEEALRRVGITAFTLKGAVSTRTRTLDTFKATPKSVLLLCLEDSPSGMNLMNANHCLLVHPMFSDSPGEASRFERQVLSCAEAAAR